MSHSIVQAMGLIGNAVFLWVATLVVTLGALIQLRSICVQKRPAVRGGHLIIFLVLLLAQVGLGFDIHDWIMEFRSSPLSWGQLGMGVLTFGSLMMLATMLLAVLFDWLRKPIK